MVSGGEDRITGNVLAPVVEGYAPRVGACMGSERGQAVKFRFPGKPSAVLLADGAVRSLHLSMVKDRFPKDEVAIGRPGEIVEGMVRVLATEPGQDGFLVIGFTVPVGVLEKGHVGFFRNVDPSVAEFEGKGDVQPFGPNRALVGLSILVEVLENDDFVIRGASGVDMRVGRGATDPKPALRIPAHLNRTSEVGELFFSGK